MGRKLDLTNQIYGRLLVIIMDWYRTNLTGRTYWFCQCECGNIISVYLGNLRSGNTESCGCLQKEKASELNRIDLTGQLFTRWFVESYNPEKSKEMGAPYYDCICIKDGNRDCVRADSLKSGHSKSCGCLTKEIASIIHSGENSHFWKGGVTSLNRKIRNSIKNKEYCEQIFERDNYMCQFFNKQGVELQVHHIKPFYKILEENNITTLEEAENCEELWDEDNAIVLSEEWHMGIKTDNPNAFHRIYGTKNFTEEDFYEWFNEFNFSGRKLGPKK